MNKVPSWLKSFLYLFFPKPDETFYLYNTITILHKRKSDHPVEDLKRQEKIFAKLVKKVNATKVKNDKLNKTVGKIFDNIKWMQKSFLEKKVMNDLLHPNRRGYQLWAEAVEPTIKKFLGEK